MGDVYRNAILVIAGCDATDSTVGLFPIRQTKPPPVRLPYTLEDGSVMGS
jgi:hypothetical protein